MQAGLPDRWVIIRNCRVADDAGAPAPYTCGAPCRARDHERMPGFRPGSVGEASDGDDDLAPGAAFLDVPDGCRGLAERVGPVDGGCDLPEPRRPRVSSLADHPVRRC